MAKDITEAKRHPDAFTKKDKVSLVLRRLFFSGVTFTRLLEQLRTLSFSTLKSDFTHFCGLARTRRLIGFFTPTFRPKRARIPADRMLPSREFLGTTVALAFSSSKEKLASGKDDCLPSLFLDITVSFAIEPRTVADEKLLDEEVS